MKPKRSFVVPLAFMVFCATAAGQKADEAVQKFVTVKNMAGTDRLQRLVGLLRVYPITVSGDNVLKVITLRGQPSVVAEAEKTIAQFDVAPRNTVEVIAYLLGASEDAAKGGSVPKSLEPVTKELTRLFGYKSFSLRESSILRASEGASAGASGFLPLAVQANYPRVYRIGFDQAEVVPDAQGKTVRLGRLYFQTEIFAVSEKGGPQPLRISADSLDLREGQSVVFGKSNLHESGDVVVVVLTARVVS